jgi:hypothetical protein
MDYLSGEIYHMVHVNNLCSIIRSRCLLSKRKLSQAEIPYRSIAYDSVQSLRDRVFIKDLVTNQYRELHCYVPFYFTTNSPMFHVQKNKKLLDQIVFLVASRSILTTPGVLFTDGNAAIQQLSQSGIEKVNITPATLTTPCMREYRPHGPYGTNQNVSAIYSDVSYLSHLNWHVINGGYIDDWEESKRVRSSEVLIPDELSINRIQCIAVQHKNIINDIKMLLEQCSLTKQIPDVRARPDLFSF